MRRFRFWLTGALVALLVAACGGPQPPAETALLTDVDLESAGSAPVADLETLRTAALDPEVEAADVASRQSFNDRSSFEPSAAKRQDPAAGDEPGYIAFAEERTVGSSSYRIRLTDGDSQRNGTLVYEGKHAIESVAVDQNGELMLFTADMGATGLDPFLFDLAGILGKKKAVYALPGASSFDETDVSMSLDGNTFVFGSFDNVSGTTNYIVLFLDRATGAISGRVFNITLGGLPIEQFDPSVSGDGEQVLFVADGPVIQSSFGAQALVRFATDGSSGALVYAGTPVLTTGLGDPSFSFDADAFLFRETFSGTNFVSLIQQSTGSFLDLVVSAQTVNHPHLSADLSGFTFALGGTVRRADLDLAAPSLTFTEIPRAKQFLAFAPYWANPLPPPPPPPPGTVIYEGTTVGAPTFDRPDGLGGTIGPVNYHAFAYTAAETGVYDITSQQDYDGFLLLYRAPFDPSQPLENVVAGNDDRSGNRVSGFRLFLEAGDYVVVTTSCGPEGDPNCGPSAGNFTNTIIPPQPADPDGTPVVQLFSLTQNLLAPSENTAIEWFVSSGTPITCEVDWGDANTETVPCEADPSGVESASHAYAADGNYVITFTATNENGSDEAKAFATVHTDDPTKFDIVVVFANDLLSPSQMAAFQGAAARWSEVIAADLPAGQPGDVPADFSCLGEPPFNGHVDDLVVSAAGIPIDGIGGTLARAGFCVQRQDGTNGTLAPLPLYGAMQFDVADLDDLEIDGGLFSTILHEMGHVLGIGSLWLPNGLVDFEPESANCRSATSFTTPPTFTGTTAVAQFATVGGSGGVPVEDEFGAGTQCSHWDEEALDNELMTGFLNTDANEPLSVITIGSLADLGYAVNLGAADPYTVPSNRLAPASAPTAWDEVLIGIGKARH
ncbi:MAG TPA: leishmanolysin-related zinc metalloendopeptidase [Trueperaceae bacterium]